MQMTVQEYAKYKLKMLQKDFLLPLSEVEIERMKSLPNETQMDAYARTLLIKYLKEGKRMIYKIIPTQGHYEVYINGHFYCSTDTWVEAVREIDNYERETVTA